MKVIEVNGTELANCVRDARRQDVILTRKGKPIALLIGVKGMDLEQLQLSVSDKFWKRVREWRKQKTITRAELEKRLAD